MIFKYLGKLFDDEIEEYQNKINKRHLYKKILRTLREEIKFLQRALKIKTEISH